MIKKVLVLLLAVILLSTSVASAKPNAKKTAVKAKPVVITTPSAQVSPFGEELFPIYGNIGGVTAKNRAKSIDKKISNLKQDMLYMPKMFTFVDNENSYDILYGEEVILGITEQQAKILGKDRETIAKEYQEIIIKVLEKERSGHMLYIILKQVSLGLLILVSTMLLIRLINVIFFHLGRKLSKKTSKTNEVIQGLVEPQKQVHVLLYVIKSIKIVFKLMVYYICFFCLLWIFPSTVWLAETLIWFVLSPLKNLAISFWNYIPDLLYIMFILTVSYYLAKFFRYIAEQIANRKIRIRGFEPDWAISTYHIFWILQFIFTLIFIFPHLPNSDSGVFKGISVFLGIIFSLGSTTFIGNIVSGFVITYMSPFKLGDRIKIGDYIGDVVEKNSLVTRIKTVKNEIITIPNSTIMSSNSVNYTQSAKKSNLVLYATVTMGYDVHWKKVQDCLIESALKTPNVMKNPAPFVFQTALNDFCAEYQINVHTQNAKEMAYTYSELYKNIADVFHREGIEMSVPSILSHKNAPSFAFPPEYMPKDEEPDNRFSLKIDGTKL